VSDYGFSLAEVSKQMLELYEQNITGTCSLLSDVTSGAGPNNQLKQLAAAQVMTDEGAPGIGQSSLLSATLKTQSQEFKTTSRSVDVEAGQEESTEAQSSLEEGEDMAESKPNITEIKRTEVTMHTLAPVTKVESVDGRTAEVKIGPPDDLKPTAMEKQRRSQVMDSYLTFDKREPSNDEVQKWNLLLQLVSSDSTCCWASITLFPAVALLLGCLCHCWPLDITLWVADEVSLNVIVSGHDERYCC
jgi:hypothetical protein